jgi:hypothetical protein
MNCRILLSLVACSTAFILAAAEKSVSPTQSKLSEVLDIKAGELRWLYQGRPLMVYAFAVSQFKPYVRELYTLRGENVLRDAPADHLHHHGLMYAIRMNGVNFWEERDSPGIEKPISIVSKQVGRNAAGLPEATFTQVIHWLAFTNREVADSSALAFLIENRTLTLTVDESTGEVALVWDARFEVGKYTPRLQLHGANYNGLGLRLPQSFDKVARFANSADAPYTGNNTQNVIPANWSSASGTMDGKDIMLALFGRSENAHGHGKFFTMTEPFAYLAVTQGLDKEPLEYKAGDKFRLRYLLTVYSENKPREFITRRAEAWSKD